MAISQYSKILQTDMASLISTVNSTLSRYGISQISSISAGSKITASLIQNMITGLKTADAHTYNTNKNYYTTTLTNANPSIGSKIYASSLATISSCASSIYSNYCSCNCNNCCSCNCDNCCACDSQSRHSCGLDDQHTCFLPDTTILTSTGFKLVQDLESGEFIYSQNGEYSQIISFWELDVTDQEIIEYSDNYLSISLTKDHYLPLKNNYFVFSKPLNTFDKILFRKNIFYPDDFIKHLPFIFSNIIKVKNNNILIKNNDNIKILLKSIFPNVEYKVIDNTFTIQGKYENFPITQFFNCFKKKDVISLPSWIFNLDENIIQFWYNNYYSIMNNKEFKLILDIYNLRNHSMVNKINKKYTGKVYNFTCNNNHNIFSTMLVGDGYSGI